MSLAAQLFNVISDFEHQTQGASRGLSARLSPDALDHNIKLQWGIFPDPEQALGNLASLRDPTPHFIICVADCRIALLYFLRQDGRHGSHGESHSYPKATTYNFVPALSSCGGRYNAFEDQHGVYPLSILLGSW